MSYLSSSFVDAYKSRSVNWGFPSGPNSLGELVYRRTYSRDGERWHRTIERVVEGTFDVVAEHCKRHGLPFDQGKARRHAEEMYERIFSFKFLPPGRGLWMMGTDYVRTRTAAPLQNCFTGAQQFFLDGRLVRFDEAAGKEGEVLCADGKLRPARVKSYGTQKVVRVVFAPKGMKSDYRVGVECTPDHAWPVQGRKTVYMKLGIQEGDAVLSSCMEHDEHVEGLVHGICFADGSAHSEQEGLYEVRLYGDKTQYRELCESHPGYQSTHEVTGESEGESGCRVYIKSDWDLKAPPPDEADVSYKANFARGAVTIDGWEKEGGSYSIDTTDEGAAVWFMQHSGLLGYTATGYSMNDDATNYGERAEPLHRVSLRFGEAVPFVAESVEDLGEQEVYCVEEPVSHTFTLEGGLATCNCGFVSTEGMRGEPDKPFKFLMDMSMLGVGVGFDVLGAGTIRWEPRNTTPESHLIADSREGWVEAWGHLIRWGFGAARYPLFDYSAIRAAGTPIKGFGGTASGPDPLRQLFTDAEELIWRRKGQDVSVRDIVDLMNLTGRCVIAGNVRRTAELALGSPFSEEFLDLKDYAKNPDRAGHGWASNNSVTDPPQHLFSSLARRIKNNGEPGIVWLEKIRKYGRLCDPPDHKDHRAKGVNPCGEQSLESFELCDLVENFPSHHDSVEDFLATLKYSTLYAKAVLLLPTHWQETNAVMIRNRRFGSSLSGVVDFVHRRSEAELIEWCRRGYQRICERDRLLSEWWGVRESIRKTSIKPSGTVSLLAGVSPGVHNPTANTYVRMVSYAADHPDVAALERAGYRVECRRPSPDEVDTTTKCVFLPVKAPGHLPTESQTSLGDKLHLAALLQKYWADNQVSCTASFDPDSEGPHLADYIRAYEGQLKVISFLPRHPQGAYVQMPYTPVDGQTYLELTQDLRRAEFAQSHSAKHDTDDNYCDGPSCQV